MNANTCIIVEGMIYTKEDLENAMRPKKMRKLNNPKGKGKSTGTACACMNATAQNAH